MALLSSAAWLKTRDFLTCLSVSNLLFIRRWYDAEKLPERSLDYFRPGPAPDTFFLATLISIAIVAIVLFGFALAVRRFPHGRIGVLGRAGFLVLLALPLETVREHWNFQAGHIDVGSTISLLLIESMLVAGVVLSLRNNPRILRVAERVALVMVLALPAFIAYYALLRVQREDPSAWIAKPSLPWLPARIATGDVPAPRLLWLLFDEFDQRVALGLRKSNVELPEIDRLRSESMYATQAEQVAGFTLLAVPSLLSGRAFTNAEPADASTLMVTPAGGAEAISWRAEPNVFQKARTIGVNVAVAGWHHPYCRVLGDSTTHCLDVMSGNGSDALAVGQQAADAGLSSAVKLAFDRREESLLDVLRPPGKERTEHFAEPYLQQRQLREFHAIRDRAFADALDPRVGLLYAHFPTPHLYAIYDRHKKDYALSNTTSYYDNLALVDRIVGELRTELERDGLWESTSILITSDHGLRHAVWKGGLNWTPEFDALLEYGSSPTVPFILKLGGKQQPVVFEQSFSAVLTGDLVLAVLSGEVATPAQAAGWLTRHSAPNKVSVR